MDGMNMTAELRLRQAILSGLILGAFLMSAGCARMVANLVHAIKGNEVPAEFKALEGKRVAVVCATDEGVGSDANGILLARYVRALLGEKVKEIKLVSQEEVDQWIDGEQSNGREFAKIGQGVKADYVVAIDMLNLRLKDGATLYRGVSDLTVAVYDIPKSGQVVFRKVLPQFSYPTMGGASALETDETKFRRIYLTRVAQRLARHFYPYEAGADVAVDAEILAYGYGS